MQNVPLLNAGEHAVQAGTVIKSFNRLRVAGVNPTLPIAENDHVIFTPTHPNNRHRACRVTVRSLEVDHRPVPSVVPGQFCGIELGCSCSELPHSGDKVYLVQSATQDEGGYPPRALVDDVPDADLAP